MINYGTMHIPINKNSVILLMGCSGSGKSTFTKRHFEPTEVVSSDACRALVCDDEGNQSSTTLAFQILHMISEARLKFKRLVVVDATNVKDKSRRPIVEMAKKNKVPCIAVVLYEDLGTCIRRNSLRNRKVPEAVILDQYDSLKESIRKMDGEGFDEVYILYPGEIEMVRFMLNTNAETTLDSDYIGKYLAPESLVD